MKVEYNVNFIFFALKLYKLKNIENFIPGVFKKQLNT